jgi:Zn-dependent peptidase ImmA (M78 family)
METLIEQIKNDLGLNNEPITVYVSDEIASYGSCSVLYDQYNDNEFLGYVVVIAADMINSEYASNIIAHELRHVWQHVHGTFRIERNKRWNEQANEIDARNYASKWGKEPEVKVL